MPVYDDKTIGLIISVHAEGRLLLDRMKQVRSPAAGPMPMIRGRLSGMPVLLAVSGIGAANAAHAATVICANKPGMVISFGIGGAYPSSGLSVGDIAVALKEVYADSGLMLSDGTHPFDTIGIPLLKQGNRRFYNVFPTDKKMTGIAVRSASRMFHVKAGTFATVSACTGTARRAAEIEKRHGPICENMEGAAAAQICTMYGVPFIELRGMSNIVEDRDRGKWDIKVASEHCQQALLEFIAELRRIGHEDK